MSAASSATPCDCFHEPVNNLPRRKKNENGDGTNPRRFLFCGGSDESGEAADFHDDLALDAVSINAGATTTLPLFGTEYQHTQQGVATFAADTDENEEQAGSHAPVREADHPRKSSPLGLQVTNAPAATNAEPNSMKVQEHYQAATAAHVIDTNRYARGLQTRERTCI